jgi:hypothetical protein
LVGGFVELTGLERLLEAELHALAGDAVDLGDVGPAHKSITLVKGFTGSEELLQGNCWWWAWHLLERYLC